MLITLLVPLRELYKLQDIVTLRHIDLCCRYVLLMALLITYIYLMEFFVAYVGGSPNERFTFWRDRIFGPYSYTWVCMLIFNSGIPMLFWMKRFRRNPWAHSALLFSRASACGSSVSSSSSARSIATTCRRRGACSIRPTSTFSRSHGTFGIFFLCYLLFIRFLPMIAIAEIRAVLPEANPHHPPAIEKPGEPAVEEPHHA